MIKREEMVPVPAVTDDFVLLGVGAKTDDGQFTRFLDDQTIPLYDESQLREEYARLESKPAKAPPPIADTKSKAPSKNQGKAQQKPANNGVEQSKSPDERTMLARYYDPPEMRQRMFANYESVRSLAQNFRGRSYNIEDANDR